MCVVYLYPSTQNTTRWIAGSWVSCIQKETHRLILNILFIWNEKFTIAQVKTIERRQNIFDLPSSLLFLCYMLLFYCVFNEYAEHSDKREHCHLSIQLREYNVHVSWPLPVASVYIIILFSPWILLVRKIPNT